jgi:hypothetical protein
MDGSLALDGGTLYAGVSAKTAEVAAFDLDGRPLRAPIRFKDERTAHSSISGLAVDGDHRLWVVDAVAGRLRTFSSFGREVAPLDLTAASEERAPLLLGRVWKPVDVEAQGTAEQGWIALAGGGEQRQAVQLFDPEGAFLCALRSHGDPGRAFHGVRRVAALGKLLYVVEGLARTVQVFREREFHFAFRLTGRGGERFEPRALAPLPDGRTLVLCRDPEPALFLVDASGDVVRRLDGELPLGDVCDVVAESGRAEPATRVFVLDQAGLRVQVLTLAGRALGSFATLARAAREKKGGR